MMNEKSKFKKILFPVLILAGAVVIAMFLIMSKKSPPKEAPLHLGALVEVLEVEAQDYPLTVYASGTVEAHQQITLEPQVNGKIIALGNRFASGTFFRKGEMLIQIEQTDYRLAVQQGEAALARAEVELATTSSQAAIARLEWDRIGLQQREEANPLTLFEPQMKNARANIASARAALDQSRLNLRRTTINAPFDARILSEQVDIGQVVRVGTQLAAITGSHEAEVIVSILMTDLPWLSIPAAQTATAGSRAEVVLRYGEKEAVWPGVVDRVLGEVDPRGRMLQVAVRVEDPYRLHEKDSLPPYLEVGMFVDVQFAGPTIKEKFVLPRRALRDNRTVWIADSDGFLRIRPVDVVRLEREQVVIGQGLEAGEKVVLTTLTGAVDGMKLRVVAERGAQ
jgi:RND family efflux transporter MFP subunit